MPFDSISAVVSAEANMNAVNVKTTSEAIVGRSQNDFICAAKIDALFEL
jgi:pterin-4a-carbinolamine dehydratase